MTSTMLTRITPVAKAVLRPAMPPSRVEIYMCNAMLRLESNRLTGILATDPKVKIRAAVSPTMRHTLKMTAERMPGMALGSTILKTVRSLEAPRP